MMDSTGVKFCSTCISSMKESIEMFNFRDYQRDQPLDTIEKKQIDLQLAWKQGQADSLNA